MCVRASCVCIRDPSIPPSFPKTDPCCVVSPCALTWARRLPVSRSGGRQWSGKWRVRHNTRACHSPRCTRCRTVRARLVLDYFGMNLEAPPPGLRVAVCACSHVAAMFQAQMMPAGERPVRGCPGATGLTSLFSECPIPTPPPLLSRVIVIVYVYLQLGPRAPPPEVVRTTVAIKNEVNLHKSSLRLVLDPSNPSRCVLVCTVCMCLM